MSTTADPKLARCALLLAGGLLFAVMGGIVGWELWTGTASEWFGRGSQPQLASRSANPQLYWDFVLKHAAIGILLGGGLALLGQAVVWLNRKRDA